MLFIEIDKEELGTDKNTIVGVIYRIPGTSAENFNHKIERSLSRISHEKNYLMGDINMDLLKSDIHKETSILLDTVYSNGFISVVCKPTRITADTESLIDHIYTNAFNTDTRNTKIQGILRTDLSDHYSIFYISYRESIDKQDNNHDIGRVCDSTSITNFSNAMERIDWECVTREGDTEVSLTIFHNKILEAHNASFPKKTSQTFLPW